MKYWMGSEPAKCDICGKGLRKAFVDGKTSMGPWGMLCLACHKEVGVGVGTGRGQKYEQQKNGKWGKTEG